MGTLARRLAQAVPGRIVLSASRLAGRGESVLRKIQGKGWNGGAVSVEVQAILSLLPASDAVVFDVGAHRGEWTRALLAAARPRIDKIWAFEPARANLDALRALPDDKVHIVTSAVSDASGTAVLNADAPGSQLASLHRRNLSHLGLQHTELETVATTRLDDFAEQHNIEVIHLLKMDIEGHELSALRGASRLFEARRIRALTFEFGGCNIDSRTYFRDFWYFLRERGFRVFRLLPGTTLLPIEAYREELEIFVTTNYAAMLETATS